MFRFFSRRITDTIEKPVIQAGTTLFQRLYGIRAPKKLPDITSNLNKEITSLLQKHGIRAPKNLPDIISNLNKEITSLPKKEPSNTLPSSNDVTKKVYDEHRPDWYHGQLWDNEGRPFPDGYWVYDHDVLNGVGDGPQQRWVQFK